LIASRVLQHQRLQREFIFQILLNFTIGRSSKNLAFFDSSQLTKSSPVHPLYTPSDNSSSLLFTGQGMLTDAYGGDVHELTWTCCI